MVVTIPGFHEITQIVRILHPLSAWIGAEPVHSKPQCFDDSRDPKHDSIWAARREMQCRRCHAPSCMGATDGQRNWPEMRKTLGKPGFLSGEDRNRTSPRFFCDFYSRTGNPPSQRFCRPTASNEPLRISLGIVAEHGAGVDRVSKMLAEPLVLRRNSIDRSGDRIRDVFANPL